MAVVRMVSEIRIPGVGRIVSSMIDLFYCSLSLSLYLSIYLSIYLSLSLFRLFYHVGAVRLTIEPGHVYIYSRTTAVKDLGDRTPIAHPSILPWYLDDLKDLFGPLRSTREGYSIRRNFFSRLVSGLLR